MPNSKYVDELEHQAESSVTMCAREKDKVVNKVFMTNDVSRHCISLSHDLTSLSSFSPAFYRRKPRKPSLTLQNSPRSSSRTVNPLPPTSKPLVRRILPWLRRCSARSDPLLRIHTGAQTNDKLESLANKYADGREALLKQLKDSSKKGAKKGAKKR